jgi:hypothetical protein
MFVDCTKYTVLVTSASGESYNTDNFLAPAATKLPTALVMFEPYDIERKGQPGAEGWGLMY